VNGSTPLPVARNKCVTVSDAFASYINKTHRSPPTLKKREKKREKIEEEKREKREREEKERKENVRDEIVCGRLLDFVIECKFLLCK
jgi:translation elongation factor EF-Ts